MNTVTIVPPNRRYARNDATREKDRVRHVAYRVAGKYKPVKGQPRESQIKMLVRAMMLLGGMCERCKNNDMRTLEIDHVNNDGAEHRRTTSTRLMYKAVFAEPLRYQLLCANCHRIKHFELRNNFKCDEVSRCNG